MSTTQQQKQSGGKRIAADSAGREKAYEKKRPNNLEKPCEKEHVNNSEKYFTIPSRMKEAQNGLYIDVGIRGINTSLLVDTGATDTILSSTVYHRIPREKRPILRNFESKVKNADGSPIDILGSATVELHVGRSVCSTEVVFANIGNVDGMLGMDFLLATNANLDLRRMELSLNGEDLKFVNHQGGKLCRRVTVEKTTKVGPGQEVLVRGRVNEARGLGIIEPLESGEIGRGGVLVARVLADVNDSLVPLRLFNPGVEDAVIKEGTMAGYFTPVSASEVDEVPIKSVVDKNGGIVPDHLQDLFERSKSEVDEVHHEMIANLLSKNQDVFVKSDTDIGRTNFVKHKINTGETQPIKQRPRRFPAAEQQEIDRQIESMLESGVIDRSESPWASNVVLVKKKDGTKRFCVDYRKLNHVTIKDAYPIPRIDDSLDTLNGSKWFSTLDLASGYWQVELEDEAKEKSAFVVRGGLYCWRVMPFGLCNAPSTFERLMERVLAGLHWKILLVYLDDIIVFANTVTEELERLDVVFSRLREAGLKLKPRKCTLFRRSVLYLGHIVSSDGVSTDPEKTRAIADWPTPTNVKEVQSFLGLASYYRRFVKGFANIARPLHRLTEKSRDFVWTYECDQAFQELKSCLQSAPILAYPDPEKDFILDTDACNVGIGAVLSQVIDGEERVVAYASRTLSKAEKNYCVTRKELLAVVSFLKKFRQYLYGRKVTVRTDHGALRWLLNFKEPQGQIARWLQVVAEYDLVIVHRAGRSHVNADSLSRRPCHSCSHCERQELDRQGEEEDDEVPCLETQVKEENVHIVKAVTVEPSVTASDLSKMQCEDESMNWIMEVKAKGERRPDWSKVEAQSHAKKSLWRIWDQLEIKQNVLCRRWESDNGEEIKSKIVLPKKCRKKVVQELHGSATGGHLGMNKTIAKTRTRYYWPCMDADIRSIVRMCDVCASKKSPSKTRRAPLQQKPVGMPMERVALDIVGPLPETEKGNKYLLVVGDYFTKWMEAYPIKDQTAKTVADKFVNEFVCRFGVPKVLHSDQGRNFESQVFSEMCSILGIEKTRTTPYNPKSDGFVERFNGTLITMVSMMIDPVRRQRDWEEKVPMALFAYRSAVQESTGETPNMLMLGREVQLPIDLTVESTSDIEEDEPETQTDYALALRERMRSAHEQARQKLAQAARHQKRTYDRKTERVCLQVGSFVWYFNPAKTKGLSPKLQRKWKGPYLITHKLSDVIYRIQRKPRGKMMVIHCDRLKPYVGEPLQSWISEPQSDSAAANAEDITGALNPAPVEEISVEDDTYTSDEHLVMSEQIPSPRSSTPTTENPSRVVDTPTPSPRRLTPTPAPRTNSRRLKPTPAPRTNPSRQRVAPKRLIQEM